MISPSPEFPVTKVGMSNRRREKPLLTYGRRPSTTPEAPLSKKRKATHDGSPLATPEITNGEKRLCGESVNAEESVEKSKGGELDATEDREEPAPQVKKGSIMSFFKPLPPKPKNSSPEPEVEEESPASPVSQSTTKRKRRTPRLLRLRPSLPTDNSIEDKENRLPESSKEHQSLGDENPPSNKTSSTSPKNTKLKSAPSIQTTLNISSRAAFSECRLCDTVWNPSHAEDVKYHKRRHAAVLRRRQCAVSAEP